MIPVKLHLTGFLSYQDPVEVDFTKLELACISGSNGAGKSSILDAITWALFGEARSRDDEALINGGQNVKAAEVIFDFQYEGNCFRVQRSKARGKATVLEFFVLSPEGSWRALTEKGVRETEKRLTQTLRMDYDTFVNASFFLQGKADHFAQQNPTNRKKVLSSVLGLEIWEVYRAQAADQRKVIEIELKSLDDQLAALDEELAEGPARHARLAEYEGRLATLNLLRQAKEATLESQRRLAASLGEQKRLLDVLGGQLKETTQRANRQSDQAAELRATRARLAERAGVAVEVESAYRAWQAARTDLERWNQVAANFHEIQAQRAGPLAQIASARAQLEEERRGIIQQAQTNREEAVRCQQSEAELPKVREQVAALRAQLDLRTALEEELRMVQQQLANLDAENRRLRGDMNALKERIRSLKEAEGANCSLCGQPLAAAERDVLILSLEADGRLMGDAFRANQKTVEQASARKRELEQEVARLGKQEDVLRAHNRRLDQLESEVLRLRAAGLAWAEGGAKRLAELDACLTAEAYAGESRAVLAQIDAAARELGYDTAAHDLARRAEQEGRASEQALRDVDTARAALEPLERQLGEVASQLSQESERLAQQAAAFHAAEEKYLSEASALPDLNQLEKETMALQAEENRLRMDTGMVRQLVAVLDNLRASKKNKEEIKADRARQAARLKVLERAFSKDGVPALLIEQALPEIEEQANDILGRLSAGNMSVRFATQRKLKSKEETRETLDILIRDASGDREYELFSGGEAFRVNFAIRLALSRVLARRAGARLQTLFIDEGFGSQDSDGRQRLLEAINLVRPEFARILVITHLEEMKEAFPSRIEVEKTPRGSQVRVMP